MITVIVWALLAGAIICFIFKTRTLGYIFWLSAMAISVARLTLLLWSS